MRPSARAEKYMCVIVIRSVTITGRTDRQTDRQSATHNAAPPREEGRIITITLAPHTLEVATPWPPQSANPGAATAYMIGLK